MEERPATFRAVIELWRSPGAMASDIGAPPANARKWEQRNSIPAEYWAAVVASEVAQGAGVTLELLAELAAARPADRGLAAEARP